MKAFSMLIVFFTILAILVAGSGYIFAREPGKSMKTCDREFNKLDSDQKGFLNYSDFQRGWHGPLGFKNIGPYGNVRSAFASADREGDGRLTPDEYCAWKSRS